MRAPTLPPPRPHKPHKKRKRRSRSWLLSFLGYSFGAGVALFIVVSAVVAYVFYDASRDLPSYDSLASYEPPVMTRIHAHNGALIAEYAKERRIFVPINTVPKLVTSAFLSAEDSRFYEHGGLDFQGIARAVFKMAQAKMEGIKRRPEGASTITQQVAKNFLLTNKRTLDRKIKEAILAIRIERAYTKDKILELYLNEIYLGIGSYGVAAAALNYFNKELKDLTIEEAAYLAALPKAPNNYHPFRHTKRATTRRDWVMSQMYRNGYITKQQYDEARNKPIKVNFRTSGAHIFAAEYFAEEVRRSLLAEYGEAKLYGGGLSVRTTLDPRLQGLAKKALIDGLVAFDRRKGWRGPVAKIDIKGDWGVALGKVDSPQDIFPWRLGVVLDVQAKKAIVGLKPGKTQAGKIVDGREAVELNFDEVKWAKKKGKKAPKSVAGALAVGDVVYVAPKDSNKLDGVWSLMQVPEVSGGLVAMDPHTGRVLAIAGGFSFDMSQFDRAVQAKRQPGSSFKPVV
nr:transglycosylase domain-containing protein [Alphaproteobacteria bacterium]